MSKSLGNYVGINEPAFEIFGKIMSISDPLMYRYYDLLTDVPQTRIDAWKREAAEGKLNPRDLKADLAKRITQDFWSEKEADEAAEGFDRVHKRGGVPIDLKATVVGDLAVSGKTARHLVDILMNLKAFPSRGEAKRVIQQGGVYLDNQRILDINHQLTKDGQEHIVKVGKRKFYKFIID
jgi:tyrosyl-tRNA synthetase